MKLKIIESTTLTWQRRQPRRKPEQGCPWGVCGRVAVGWSSSSGDRAPRGLGVAGRSGGRQWTPPLPREPRWWSPRVASNAPWRCGPGGGAAVGRRWRSGRYWPLGRRAADSAAGTGTALARAAGGRRVQGGTLLLLLTLGWSETECETDLRTGEELISWGSLYTGQKRTLPLGRSGNGWDS